jgi:hypothetical protein
LSGERQPGCIQEGDIGKYSANFILLLDYDIRFTVLTTGDDATNVANLITDTIASIGVPTMEMAVKEEAKQVYSGTYGNSETNDTLGITLDGKPGLLITEWRINGSDFKTFRGNSFELRLYPGGLQSKGGKKLGFRMVRNQTVLSNGLIVLNCVD